MGVLKRVCGVTRRGRKRNVDILTIDRDIVELLQTRRLTYVRHVSRMQPDRFFFMDTLMGVGQKEDHGSNGRTT